MFLPDEGLLHKKIIYYFILSNEILVHCSIYFSFNFSRPVKLIAIFSYLLNFINCYPTNGPIAFYGKMTNNSAVAAFDHVNTEDLHLNIFLQTLCIFLSKAFGLNVTWYETVESSLSVQIYGDAK